MSLFKQIKDDQLQSRVNRDKLRTAVLTSVYSDVAAIGKNQNREPTDQDVIAVLKKTIKGLESFKGTVGESQANEERNILEAYLPEEPSTLKLSQVIDVLISGLEDKSMKQMKALMEELNRQYPLGFDRAYASKYIKEQLS